MSGYRNSSIVLYLNLLLSLSIITLMSSLQILLNFSYSTMDSRVIEAVGEGILSK